MESDRTPRLPVSLRAVSEEMDLLNPDWVAYINRRTGELITVTDDDAQAARGESVFPVPGWQAELLPVIREVLSSGDFLALPGRFEIDEYRILERFCRQVSDPRVRDDLLRAIAGKGAFRFFKARAHHHGLLDEWYAYRDGALQDFAAEWLEENGIPYTREPRPKAPGDA